MSIGDQKWHNCKMWAYFELNAMTALAWAKRLHFMKIPYKDHNFPLCDAVLALSAAHSSLLDIRYLQCDASFTLYIAYVSLHDVQFPLYNASSILFAAFMM